MSGRSRFAVLLLAFMLVVGTGATFVSAQTDGEYSVEAQNTIDIPDRTVTVEGTDYTVSSVGKVTAGETLEASVSGSESADVSVDLYSGDRTIVNSDVVTDGSVSFSTENLRPGTYILAVYTDGSIVSIQPVVVAGYETTLNGPGEIPAGESGDVTVQLDDVADLGSPENVELVVTQDDEVVETVQMDSESTYEYSAEVGSSLESGEYRMYAVVHNETTVSSDDVFSGDNDVVGVTDAQTLTVSGGESQSQDDGESNSGDSGSSGSAGDGSDETETPSETEMEVTPTATELSETSEEPATTTTEMAATETASESETEAPSGTSTDSTMPNFALYIVALALVAAALIARR
ncbi:hypothetical protein NDI76_16050 [Halogeometricum sp. S1BR25-6]|uniref:PGF-CTERM sorting domain-containing protein n=1 Tax=Halogeometricum salsisoli TaxID=2950536 RepID=A0ABU2GHG9_9EURY|nr:hypothetical protein [Halogeometricum sp. S1BR25-6]MDS0300260.1 hypothetical protein [Halogeometricum sp. S1BR25-6]